MAENKQIVDVLLLKTDPNEDEDCNYLISMWSNLLDIIEHILIHLPMKDLHRCARVSKKWNIAVKRIKKSRKQISWLFYSDTEVGGVDVQISDKIANLASEPDTALIFCSASLFESTLPVPSKLSTSRHPRATKMDKLKFISYLERVLPPSCGISGLVADGIIGTEFNTLNVKELESSFAASCLLLPKLDNFDVISFEICEKDPTDTAPESSESDSSMDAAGDFHQGVGPTGKKRFCYTADTVGEMTGIATNKDVKLILLFITDPYYADSTDFGKSLLKRYGDIVIAGGYTDNIILGRELHMDPEREYEPTGVGVAFCGPNLEVASLVLRSNVSNPTEVETNLLHLKSANISEANSIAFVFACIGRGQHFYNGQANVESTIFRKVFPRTPLFGFFGNGEIGFDFPIPNPEFNPSKEEDGDISDEDSHLPVMYHSYCSVFVIVSFK